MSYSDESNPQFPSTPIKPKVVNNVNGVSYLCTECQVRGRAADGELLFCWCCKTPHHLQTGVGLKVGDNFAVYRSNDPGELTAGAARSDDN